ncbi:proline racemase [Alsobacter metallidurans]|uniref:4-hydroxyproline epimerase n=1 Tax=Alsobacter metallidurans TaxID=340221 RepID=A0A917MKE0_9HYPH|nr:proline racemase family protein [Alsobacter metallidurans]GGH34147.1 proline racemase [Alsobacter metallidurans]
MRPALELAYTDMHTAGEPVRILTGGYPSLQGDSVLAKRRDARDNHDHLRRATMLEPRGHAGMYGVIPVRPSHPGAVLGVLFTHNEGYSTMCGHATVALGRWVVDQGLVPKTEPETRFVIEAPCGPLALACTVRDGEVTQVRFESVPAYAHALDLSIDVPGFGKVVTDIGYGGAFYAILPSSRFGLDFFATPLDDLVAAGGALTDVIRREMRIAHPTEPDLGFLYGTILTDDAGAAQESWNLCVFAERQVDRSPTGSGVTARMALDCARGLLEPGQTRVFRGISGGPFTGRVTRPAPEIEGAVRVEVGGQGYYAGRGTFLIEPDDPLGEGFALAGSFGEARRG